MTVGKPPSTKEFVEIIINVNGLGIFVMTEGKALLLTIAICIVGTLILNAIVYGVINA